MKTVLFGAAAVALSLGVGATPAFARAPDPQPAEQWRTVSQPGPRSDVPVARKRVRVPDQTQTANCACEMMRMSPGECMKPMPEGNRPSAG